MVEKRVQRAVMVVAYYKELIKNLHICTSGDCFGCTLRTNKVNCKDLLLASVEGVIEQLVKERDAAVADLKSVLASECGLNQCRYCKYQEDDYQCHHDCIPYSEKWGWEWRGVQEDNDAVG